MTKFQDMKPPPWETTTQSGRADLRLHPLVREAYKVACLIEDCGGSPDLTTASSAAFRLTELLSDMFRAGTQINGYQIKRLLDFVDNDDESEVSLAYIDHQRPDGNSNDGEMMPKGLYAWYTDYPDEGSIWLPETPAEHMASVTPPDVVDQFLDDAEKNGIKGEAQLQREVREAASQSDGKDYV